MSSNQSFIEYIIEQLESVDGITYKKMFGEYGIWRFGKIVALVCDNQLFVKPTEAGRQFIGDVTEAPPYPDAKNSFLIENIEQSDWLSQLIEITDQSLPAPKPKKKKK